MLVGKKHYRNNIRWTNSVVLRLGKLYPPGRPSPQYPGPSTSHRLLVPFPRFWRTKLVIFHRQKNRPLIVYVKHSFLKTFSRTFIWRFRRSFHLKQLFDSVSVVRILLKIIVSVPNTYSYIVGTLTFKIHVNMNDIQLWWVTIRTSRAFIWPVRCANWDTLKSILKRHK